MDPLVVAVLVGIVAYAAVILLFRKQIMPDSTEYTRNLLQQLSQEQSLAGEYAAETTTSVLRTPTVRDSELSRIFFMLPGTTGLEPKLLKAGLMEHIDRFFIMCIVFLVIALYALKGLGILSIPAAIVLTYMFGHWRISRNVTKRNNAFLDNFPDALDMIVRSVRSGYPLNAAVRMVADNMQPPVSNEFKQVADEVAYGSTLIDALQRLAERIDEPDVHFFVVVLTVQQDIGGNLSEVLNNLAGIIRKRKHLRMKIRALSSEGRTTAWVLGSMPVAEALLILAVNPDHLTPLFVTPLGNFVLGATLCIVALGAFIVTRMVSIRV